MKSETNTKEALEVLGEVGGGWVGNLYTAKTCEKNCVWEAIGENIEQVLFTIIVKSYF